MKRFVTALTVIIATVAIVFAIVPTTFAVENGDEWLAANNYHISIVNQRCDAKMTYDNDTIIVTITNPTFDYKVECTMWVGRDKNKPAAVSTPVKYILPDDTIFDDCVNKAGKFGFYSNKAKAGDIENGYDENGNATMVSRAMADHVNHAFYGSETYDDFDNDIKWDTFEKIMKERINQWRYNPVIGKDYDIGYHDANKVLNAAKGTRYEDLIAEWVNKVETEKAAYNGEPAPVTTPVVPTVNTSKFTDVAATHWANANIEKVAEIGAFNGYEDGTFRPDNQITHEEFVKVIMAIIYDGDVTAAPKAAVTWADWSQPYLNAAFETGIVTAADTDLVATGTPITRAEMAKIIVRALDYLGKTIIDNYATQDMRSIADWNNIPDEYKPYIRQAYFADILAGYEDGTFKADKSLTRAETDAVVMRIANN